MVNINIVLLIIAAVLFFLAAIGAPSSPRFNYVAAGLFCWVLTLLIR